MIGGDPQASAEMLDALLQPWYDAVDDPAKAQQEALHRLLKDYAQTAYGAQHGAAQIDTVDDYRRAFPVATYDDYRPLIGRVMAGEISLLLAEEPVGWAITRGTTKGESKFIPMTPTDLAMRISAGRAMMNYVRGSQQFDLFQGVNLNLNFPSAVGMVQVGEREVEYGYSLNLNYPSVVGTMDVAGQETPYGFSSGIYVRHAAAATLVEILPAQEEIDALGGGTTSGAWERRFDFEMIYQRTKDAPITMCAGVCPSIIAFGHYLQRRHKVLLKELWPMRVIAAASVPGIHTKYKPALRALYGPVDVVEMYIATEGTFAQQRDERRLLVPNYDLYVFEVQMKGGWTKMLHEMRPGEYGSLIVSTPVLPRYCIGDLVRAFDPPYFRCIGRQGRWARLRYWLEGIVYLDFGRA